VPNKLDDAFFRALFHSPLGGIAVVDLNSVAIIEINEVLLGLLGCTQKEIVGVPHAWVRFTPPEYRELDERALREVHKRGYSEPFEKEYERADGSRVSVRVRTAIVPEYPDRLIVFVADLSQQQAARQRERAAQQRLEIALSAAEQGVWDYDLVTGEMSYSERAKSIYGFEKLEKITFEQVRDATHPEDLPITHAQFRRAIDPSIRDRSSYEYRIVRPDGSICWALAFGEAVFVGPLGHERAVRYVGTLQDITPRKDAERRQEVLVAELNHRVKNMLAIVQSVAFQTMHGKDIPEELSETFSGRLQALAAAHTLLSEAGWDGAQIREIAIAALEPIVPDLESRVNLRGDAVLLTPQAAVSLGMALYELATNATKYGSLSTPTGLVELIWTKAEPGDANLSITWSETGGPRVEEPSSFGFGTRMIRRVLAGNVALQFEPEGLVCTIETPLSGVVKPLGASNISESAFRLLGQHAKPSPLPDR
jgi:PAS domain S-box-containing protein